MFELQILIEMMKEEKIWKCRIEGIWAEQNID
jgi:hypothetical protein